MKTKHLIAALAVGVATLASPIHAQVVDLNRGSTSVTPDPGFLAAADSLGVTVAPLSGRRLNFPITSGVLDLGSAAGEILHSNGLSLSAGGTVVQLSGFIIDTGNHPPVLTGLVRANGAIVGRIPLFTISLPDGLTLPLRPSGRFGGRLDLDGFGLTLTDEAAGALNGVFSVDAFTDELFIGTARIRSTVRLPRMVAR